MPKFDGPDISQYNPIADWGLMPQFRLFITKIGGGTSDGRKLSRDPVFDVNWEEMRNRNFEFRGCYFWIRSDLPQQDQLDVMKSAVNDHGGLRPGEFVMIDWETTPGTDYPTASFVQDFQDLCEAEWPRRVLMYGSDWVPNFAEWRNANPDYPLMYANYNLTDTPVGGPAETTYWNADIWQWTSSADINGFNDKTIDMNEVLNWETLEKLGTGAESMTMYPDGYGTAMITLERMQEKHGAKMHPEYRRRFFAYIEAKGGLLGVGGGFRYTQPPDKPGFAPPGKSFHENQLFASGITAYSAVDLVVPRAGASHRSPTWAECADAPGWSLHTFINGEPWHIQCIEMRGHGSWVNAGRPDPQYVELPGTTPPPVEPPVPPQVEEIFAMYTMIVSRHGWPGPISFNVASDGIRWIRNGHVVQVDGRVGVPSVEATKEEMLGMLSDRPGIGDDPFGSGAYADPELHAAWNA